MERCIVCKKKLAEDEHILCKTCDDFFNKKHTDEEISEILDELEKVDKEVLENE
jgi:hypothetical protein